MAGEDLRLAIKRRPPGVLGRRDPGDERRRGHAALDQARARLGLNHCALAGPTGVFGADRAQDPKHRRNPIDHVVEVFADAVKSARAARARCRLRLDRHIDAGEMLGQGADVAITLLARFRRDLVPTFGVLTIVIPGVGAATPASIAPRANDNCSAMMTTLFSDRAPKMIVLSLAIVACRASILPSRASTISINRSGSRGRFSWRSAMEKH